MLKRQHLINADPITEAKLLFSKGEGAGLTKNDTPRIFYGYWIVIICVFLQFLGWGLTQTFGVFFNPILAEFGWSRAVISGSFTLNYFVYGFANILAGRMADRFGPRIVISICGILLGSGCMLMSQIHQAWHLYLVYGLIIGLGISGVDVVLLATIARWFLRKRGTMSGFMKVGAGLCIFVMPLVVNWLIGHYGWRNAYIIMGVPIMVLYILAAQFLRRNPEQMGLVPDGEVDFEDIPVNLQDTGLTLNEAFKTRQFWMICIISISLFFSTLTIITQIVPHIIAINIPSTTAVSILSVLGIGSIIGRLTTGTLSDHIGHRMAMGICILTMTTSLLWLQAARELWMLYLFAVLNGFAHGAFYTSISPLVADYFGLRMQGSILGVVFCCGPALGALGPIMAGKLFDLTGSYYPAFLICMGFTLTALVMIILLKPIKIKSIGEGAR